MLAEFIRQHSSVIADPRSSKVIQSVSKLPDSPTCRIAPTLICALVGLFFALAGEPRGIRAPFPPVLGGQLIFTVYVFLSMYRHRRANSTKKEPGIYNKLLVLFPILVFLALALEFELIRAFY